MVEAHACNAAVNMKLPLREVEHVKVMIRYLTVINKTVCNGALMFRHPWWCGPRGPHLPGDRPLRSLRRCRDGLFYGFPCEYAGPINRTIFVIQALRVRYVRPKFFCNLATVSENTIPRSNTYHLFPTDHVSIECFRILTCCRFASHFAVHHTADFGLLWIPISTSTHFERSYTPLRNTLNFIVNLFRSFVYRG